MHLLLLGLGGVLGAARQVGREGLGLFEGEALLIDLFLELFVTG